MTNAEKAFDEGARFMNRGNFIEALAAFKRYIDEGGEPSKGYTNIGLIYASQHRIDLAIEQWQKAVEHNQGDAAAYFNMGNAYRSQRRYTESLSALQKAVELKPRELAFIRLLGKVQEDAGDLHGALSTCLRALELAPCDHELHNSTAIIYGKLDRLNDAITHLEEAVRLKPDFGGALGNLAMAFWQKRDMEKARYYTEKAQKFGGNVHPDVLHDLHRMN